MEIADLTKKRIIEYLDEKKRFDKRKLLEYRNIKIRLGISKQAEGSASVRIGKTEVVAGVKLDIAEPYTDSPDKGSMMVTTELLPLASEKFEAGPPRINAIELSRIVDRGIRESGFIDFKKLCIKKGEKIWMVFIDIYPLNDDGNLIDTSFLAAVSALRDAFFPKMDEKKEKVEYGKLTEKKLPLKEMPFMLTIHKIGKSIILDPITEEEESSEARVSFAISPEKKEAIINAIQKGGEKELTKKEVFEIIDVAIGEWKRIYPTIVEKITEAEKRPEEKIIQSG